MPFQPVFSNSLLSNSEPFEADAKDAFQASRDKVDVTGLTEAALTQFTSSQDPVFWATSAPEFFFGGDGVDIVSYERSHGALVVDLANPWRNQADATGDTFLSIEALFGSDFRDDLRGTGGDNVIYGNAGDDFILGRSGNDEIHGGVGNDYIEGGKGADTIDGGAGDDTSSYAGAKSSVVVDLVNSARNKGEAAGDIHLSIETIVGSDFDDDLRASGANDNVFGGDGHDFILARSGHDVVHGEAGNDRLEGGAGDDILYGGQGTDALTGGAGRDTFVVDGSGGADVITDFEDGTDILFFDQVGTFSEIGSSWSQVGDDVVFDFGSGNSVTVKNAMYSELQDDLLIEMDVDDPLSLVGWSSGVVDGDVDAPFVFEFSEDISAGDGQIDVMVFGENGYEVIETLDANDIAVTGTQLEFSLEEPLGVLRDYALDFGEGIVETIDGDAYRGTYELFETGLGVSLPSLDFGQYDQVIDGATFTGTLSLDAGDSNTLIINSTFENIDGSGITLRNVENVTIANSTFRNIDDFGILMRSSGSSDSVTITGNTFEDVGRDAIHAAKRFANDVDHTNLIVHDNDIHDVASDGFHYHGIYVQSSEAVVWGNEVTGTVGGNGISIRADGIVYDNYVDVTTGRDYGAGIKYFSDHLTGPSKTLIIADNVVEGNNLHAGIQLDQTGSNQPSAISDQDWVVNNFYLLRNDVDGRSDYAIDASLDNASWATIALIDDAPSAAPEPLRPDQFDPASAHSPILDTGPEEIDFFVF